MYKVLTLRDYVDPRLEAFYSLPDGVTDTQMMWQAGSTSQLSVSLSGCHTDRWAPLPVSPAAIPAEEGKWELGSQEEVWY